MKNNMDEIVNKILNNTERRLQLIKTDNNESIGNFEDISKQSNLLLSNSRDFFVPVKDFEPDICAGVAEHEGVGYDSVGFYIKQEFESKVPFTSNGLQSYCTLLGISASYARKCIAAQKIDLLLQNFNEWHKDLSPDKKLLIRTSYDKVEAVLSDRYSIFDDNEVLDCVYGILAPHNNFTVKNYSLTSSGLHLRIVCRDKITINGEDLSYGFDIRNSGIGKSSVEINLIMFKWACSNGMIFGGGQGTVYKQRHVAVSREQLVKEFTAMLNEAPGVVRNIQDVINRSMDTKLNSDTIQKIIDEMKYNSILDGAVQKVKSQVLRNNEDGSIYTVEDNLWNVVNIITAQSQLYNIDTRVKMEKQASIILSKYVA